MITFPQKECVIVRHQGLIGGHQSIQVSRTFYNETQKYWNAFYMDSHLISCKHIEYPSSGHRQHLTSMWEYNGLSSEGCLGYPLEPKWTNADHQLLLEWYRCSFPWAMFVVDHLFFSHNSASFRCFENVECHLCTADSAVPPDMCASLNELIVSVTAWQRQTKNCVVHIKNSRYTQKFEINVTT